MVAGACQRCRELISLRLDELLSELDVTVLERHLAWCADCRDFACDLTGVAALLRAAEPVGVPEPVRIDLSRPLAFRARVLGGTIAAVVAAAAVGVSVDGFVNRTQPPNVTMPTASSADLASMRAGRAHQLRPVALGLDRLRVRVL